VIESIVVEL